MILGCAVCRRDTKLKRGLCPMHYRRWRTTGKFGPVGPMRASRGSGYVCSEGYRRVTVDGKQVYQHRHVMERQLGRKLASDEHVHHVDGDKLNNDPSNLRVVSATEHGRLHGGWVYGRFA